MLLLLCHAGGALAPKSKLTAFRILLLNSPIPNTNGYGADLSSRMVA
jgi:hypothetical protein